MEAIPAKKTNKQLHFYLRLDILRRSGIDWTSFLRTSRLLIFHFVQQTNQTGERLTSVDLNLNNGVSVVRKSLNCEIKEQSCD